MYQAGMRLLFFCFSCDRAAEIVYQHAPGGCALKNCSAVQQTYRLSETKCTPCLPPSENESRQGVLAWEKEMKNWKAYS